MFKFFYTLLIHLLFIGWLPVLLYNRVVHGKYKKSWRQKLGMRLPQIHKEGRFLIWIHAPSFGEAKAVAPLAKLIQKNMPEACLIISTTTETGLEIAKQGIPQAEAHFILPLDLPYIMRPFVHSIEPDLVILTETDFWFHFVDAAKECEAVVAVVNGKISERSLKRYTILPWLSAPLFQSLDLVCPQNDDYRERFLQLGIPPDHLYVTGNIKLDDTFPHLGPIEEHNWRGQLGLSPKDAFLVIGSTHENEERWLLAIVQRLWKKWPELKVAIVPRHPERFKTVAAFLEKKGEVFARYSLGQGFNEECHLMLVDAMGILRQLYQLSTIAIVAGSYSNKVGGHNLLEPSWYGKPVIFGPHTHTQTEMAAMLISSGGGKRVPLAALEGELHHLLEHPEEREAMGEAGRRIFAEAKGATERTWQLLRVMISQKLWQKHSTQE